MVLRMPVRATLLLLLLQPAARAARLPPNNGSFYCDGWDSDGVLQYAALRVQPYLDATIDITSINDDFDWPDYEEGIGFDTKAGKSRVQGKTGWSEEPLVSHVTRSDAVQHGYFLVYTLDNSTLRTPETPNGVDDYFFSITLDVGLHEDYEAAGVEVNRTLLRFSLFGESPADFSSPDTRFLMQPELNNALYSRDIGVDDPFEQRHSFTWGFETDDDTGALVAPCDRNVSALTVTIFCMRGFKYMPCVSDATAKPTIDDCRRYCPYTLTVRAVPRALKPGVPITSLIANGDWQAFRIDIGPYELMQVTPI